MQFINPTYLSLCSYVCYICYIVARNTRQATTFKGSTRRFYIAILDKLSQSIAVQDKVLATRDKLLTKHRNTGQAPSILSQYSTSFLKFIAILDKQTIHYRNTRQVYRNTRQHCSKRLPNKVFFYNDSYNKSTTESKPSWSIEAKYFCVVEMSECAIAFIVVIESAPAFLRLSAKVCLAR